MLSQVMAPVCPGWSRLAVAGLSSGWLDQLTLALPWSGPWPGFNSHTNRHEEQEQFLIQVGSLRTQTEVSEHRRGQLPRSEAECPRSEKDLPP